MSANHRYPIIPPDVLARCHQEHEAGDYWMTVARRNGVGVNALMRQLEKAGYDTSTKHPARRPRETPEPVGGWDANLAARMLREPLRMSV